MAPKSVTFRRHDHLVSVLFGDLLSHSYNNTFSMFLYLVHYTCIANTVSTVINDTFSPVQVGGDSLQVPFGLNPSPPQVTLSSPSKLNPGLQVKVATVPKSCGEVVSGL